MNKSSKKSRTRTWLIIGILILIALLMLWLTISDLTGNTDVAAFVIPQL